MSLVNDILEATGTTDVEYPAYRHRVRVLCVKYETLRKAAEDLRYLLVTTTAGLDIPDEIWEPFASALE